LTGLNILPIGAFDIIKNSQNINALSDGYDLKGSLFQKEEKLDSAFYCFETALKLSKQTGYKSRMAWSYYHLAELSVPSGDLNAALINFKNAEKLFNEINDEMQYYNSIC
jgi:tetratricopeptide (TPR) repeat protein